MPSTIIQTQPASEAMKMAIPSHSTGWRYHAAWRHAAGSAAAGIGVVREVIDVGGDHVDLVVAQARTPRRHVALATVVDGLLDVGHAATVQPHVIGEVGRAQRGIALAFGTVAGGAGGEQWFGRRDRKSVV